MDSFTVLDGEEWDSSAYDTSSSELDGASVLPPMSSADMSVLALIVTRPPNAKDMFTTLDQLFTAYPMLKFDSENPVCKKYWWRDIAKAATPKKSKNSLNYDPNVFFPLLEKEQYRMLKARNNMKHAMSVLRARGNKKALLRIVGYLEGAESAYVAGGDPRPDTRRVILFYEQEGGITAKKRKSSLVEAETMSESSSRSASDVAPTAAPTKKKAKLAQSIVSVPAALPVIESSIASPTGLVPAPAVKPEPEANIRSKIIDKNAALEFLPAMLPASPSEVFEREYLEVLNCLSSEEFYDPCLSSETELFPENLFGGIESCYGDSGAVYV